MDFIDLKEKRKEHMKLAESSDARARGGTGNEGSSVYVTEILSQS